MDTPINVMIVDDHDMVRLGLRTYLMLDADIRIYGEAGNGLEAIRILEEAEAGSLPDVVLMDLMMPEMGGIAATAEISKRFPTVKIVMLTSFLEDEKVVKAVEAGAAGYVLKTVSSGELIPVIRGAFEGKPILAPEVSQALTRALRSRSAHSETEDLTSREKEVLLLIAEGKSNKEIGEELHISIKTVKTHVSNLLMKCDLADRTQLAIFAHRKGLTASS